ncbi:hypothetical protein Avbf_06454 [Armadillidium vulgare]|nr:hypothetical protein Avbf_06454 [Armadillidium vulgare]
MTGSYSEILDDSHETDPECENTLICDDTCISDVQPHELGENRKETNSKISALSVECVETYRDAVCKTCDAVDSNIKVRKEIRRLLDLFEGAVFSSSAVGGGAGT